MIKKILSEQDRNLFREAVGEVRAVKKDKVHDYLENKPKPFPKRPQVLIEEATLSEVDIAVVGSEDDISYLSSNLSKTILQKLRQGYFEPEAEMDLHGCNAIEAKRELLIFLADCNRAGFCCVHIVHGKGYRSNEAYPVLKNYVNLWLRQHKDVRAFCSAPAKDGGTGAVYVLLNKP